DGEAPAHARGLRARAARLPRPDRRLRRCGPDLQRTHLPRGARRGRAAGLDRGRRGLPRGDLAAVGVDRVRRRRPGLPRRPRVGAVPQGPRRAGL
ncbi:MAG: hypothetical protein AVDCRST_MAG54-2510, partial [uncultured Actinomycetospora sp.]